MTPTESTVVVSMSVTALSVSGAQLTAGKLPAPRPLAGVALAGFVLLLGARSSGYGNLSAKFATLIATTAVLTTGYKALGGASRYFGGPRFYSDPAVPNAAVPSSPTTTLPV